MVIYGNASFFLTAPNGAPWGGETLRQRSHTFNCRMLMNFVHGQGHGLSEERAGGRYETMQCFALTQPRAMMEEGEGVYWCNNIVISSKVTPDNIAIET